MPCPKSNAKLARDFVTCVLDNAFTQYVSFPTRENNFLDLVLCKNLSCIPDVKLVAPVVKSDHDCIMMTLDIQYKSSFTKAITNVQNSISKMLTLWVYKITINQ